MRVLGISCYFHDAAAALLDDGVLVAAAEEERFTRRKHDAEFPHHAIDFCLEQAGISAADLDWVVFFEKPFRKFERLLMTSLQTTPRSFHVFREAMIHWLGNKLWIRPAIEKRFGIARDRILFSEHHLSHAASAFLCSPYDEAAILTVDGVGEWATATLGIGRGNQIKLLKEVLFPHSLGLLYSTFTAFLGFEVNEGEYKVMGMAPFGTPRYAEEVRSLVRLDGDGGFHLDMRYFDFHRSLDRSYSRKFLQLFGAPRDPERHFFTSGSGFPPYFGKRPTDFDQQAEENQHYADIAASVQLVTEELVVAMAQHARRFTGMRRLCMAGGVALNSVANGRVLREAGFEEIFIQPAAGDGGGALGAALWAYHCVLNQPRRFVMDHAYFGQAHDEAQIAEFLAREGVGSVHCTSDEELVQRVVSELTEGRVVGWFQGRFEFGPRALGNRSILADPRRADMKDIINTKIKFREPFRPFAPSVLIERAEEYFELPEAARHYPARYMLYVVPVKPEKRALIPAVTHVDGTARPQLVERKTNPLYYQLIERFGEATGVPVVLNTSFNLRGEPIVNTPEEAFRSFVNSGMDVLVLGRNIVSKRTAG